jgi:hypothetical protein
MNWVAFSGLLWVACAFAAIHAIEYSSYMARMAGVTIGKRVSGYVFQNAIYVFTRFFYLSLMPVLGLCVDIGVSSQAYLVTVHVSLLLATVTSVLALVFRYRILGRFERVLSQLDKGSLYRAIVRSIKSNADARTDPQFKTDPSAWRLGARRDWGLVILSSLVFTAYAIGVFSAFYFALLFPDYRTAISQMSGLINGAATVLLTFVIEPRLSARIDSHSEEVEGTLSSLLWGRLLGVGVFSHLVIGILWLVGLAVQGG